MTPVASEGIKPSNTMGVARRMTTGQVFLTNQIVTLCGLDPTEAQVMDLLRTGRRAGRTSAAHPATMMLPSAVVLLQTPTVGITLGGSRSRSGARSDEKLLPAQAEEMQTDWGPYAPAIHRWERVLGRPAPSPTEPNKNGKPRLSPAFCEWMMGVPKGWITGTPGVSRNDQLKAAGNGVVPQQAAAALRDMLAAFEAQEEAA